MGTVYNGYMFAVKDYSVGISEEDLPRVAEEFYMVDKSRTRKQGVPEWDLDDQFCYGR